MCGIVGTVAERPIVEILIEGLKRLEYRGYDSAGVVVLDQQGNTSCIKREGKVEVLAKAVKEQSPQGTIGIAHTLWATHGVPSERNAHHLITPILFSIPLQFQSYYVALVKGTDVNQPRNLAKSVTVQ